MMWDNIALLIMNVEKRDIVLYKGVGGRLKGGGIWLIV